MVGVEIGGVTPKRNAWKRGDLEVYLSAVSCACFLMAFLLGWARCISCGASLRCWPEQTGSGIGIGATNIYRPVRGGGVRLPNMIMF